MDLCALLREAVSMMNYLQVTCAICGHQAVVAFYQRMDRVNPVPAFPDLWICDLHLQGEVE